MKKYILYLFTSFLIFANSFEEVKPILEKHCLSCHNQKSKLVNGGNLSLETWKDVFKGGFRGVAIIKNEPEKSLIYQRIILEDNNPFAMPPRNRYRALTKTEKNSIYNWIKNGADWKATEKLKSPRLDSKNTNEKELTLIKKIYDKIIITAKKENNSFEKYTETQYDYTITLLPVKTGTVILKGTEEDDVIEVEVSAFWMSKNEITWELFDPFMTSKYSRHKDGSLSAEIDSSTTDDIIARPTPPYHAMNFGMPTRKHPAIGMTQHSANKFCQWLSYKTGHFYRLPTEAEWEYAARAGAKDANYIWGDDKSLADDYAWYEDNSSNSYQRVGKKKANAWGFHDMYGNVQEWTLDQYVKNKFKFIGKKKIKNLWIKSVKPYPHVTKGGYWDGGLDNLKMNASIPSSPDWKASDPQFPKSIWYMTDIAWCGMRIVRSKDIPSIEEMYAYWNSGVAYDDD